MGIQDSFLLDEVRSGFMIPAAMKQAWAAELEVLMEIDRVCKKHNIQYFADWGTLLGAVRHGGFVPWDDDLDIVMKRDDYNKFMTVARFDMAEGFDVQTFRTQENFWLFMGKVVGRNRFCFEKEHLRRFHNFFYIACVDIFVLDYVYRNPEKEEKRRILCKYMLGVADSIVEGRLAPKEKEKKLNKIEEMYGKKISRIDNPVGMGRYLYGEVEKIFAEVPEQDADSLTQLFPYGLKGSRRHYAKEYYAQSVELPFECTTMPVPMMYEKLLRQRYGDYMRLVKSAGAHNYPFFEGQKKNLQKVLDFELPEFYVERKKLLRSEKEESYKIRSYKAMAKEYSGELWKIKEQLSETIAQAHIKPENSEQTVELLQMSQQLAIDLGTILEQFLGDNSPIIRLLEQYCEELYVLYEQLLSDIGAKESAFICDRLDELQRAVTATLEQHILRRKTVLFLPVLSKDWSGLHGLWKAAVSDPLYDTYTVPLPYFYKDYDGSPRRVCCDVVGFPEELHVLEYKLLTPEYLEMLHPEIIIIQNPYDSWNSAISVEKIFYSENLRKYTDTLIYVPPFAVEEYTKRNAREYFNMKYYVTMPGVVYADYTMVQSENMRTLYIDRLTEFAGEETRDIWEQRVIVADLPVMNKENIKNTNQKKKILYGISLSTYMGDIEAAQGKIERNLRLFETYKDQIVVKIQIFPNNNAATEIRNYIIPLLESSLGEIVDAGVECCAKDYDLYYGDAMPVVMEFREAGKPAMLQEVYE